MFGKIKKIFEKWLVLMKNNLECHPMNFSLLPAAFM